MEKGQVGCEKGSVRPEKGFQGDSGWKIKPGDGERGEKKKEDRRTVTGKCPNWTLVLQEDWAMFSPSEGKAAEDATHITFHRSCLSGSEPWKSYGKAIMSPR